MKISKILGVGIFLIGLMISFTNCSNGTTDADEDSGSNNKVNPIAKKSKSLGEKVFITCAACHSVKKDEPHKVGPNLNGIFGRKAGAAEGFKYSEAMINSDITWTEEKIVEWLEKPTDFLPGTTMAFVGITNKEHQKALIEYLKEATK